MEHKPNIREMAEEWCGNYKSYVFGFAFSLMLTLCSFGLVLFWNPGKERLIVYLIGLALMQALVQLTCFLHVFQEQKPRWKLFAFFGMVLILFIIAGGSFWIMNDLNTRTMHEMIHD